MSTILEALRKAKQKLPQESVDAPKGILSDNTHDYLAHVPPNPFEDHSRLLKYAIALGCVILLVLVTLITLVLLKRPAQIIEMKPVVAQIEVTPQTTPTFAPTPVATPTPVEAVISLTVETAPSAPANEEQKVPSPKKAKETETTQPTSPVTAEPSDMESPVPVETALPDAPTAISSEENSTPVRQNFASTEGLAPQNVKIDGILWDSTDPMAMINGKTVRVGSKVNGMEVLKINKDSVVFSSDGKQTTIKQ